MMTIKKVWVDDTAVYAKSDSIIFIIFIELVYNIRIQIQIQR